MLNKKFRPFCIVLFLFLINRASIPQDNTRIPSENPRLIIGIIVSQMRSDYIYRFWDKYEEKGFKKLITRGTYCKNASFNYLLSQEGVGHATIATGALPASHGIVSKEWYLSLQDKIVQSVEDEKYNTVGGSYESGKYSPENLMCTTFSDELRLSNNMKSKVFGISLNPAPAILSSGHIANDVYWFDEKTGNWVTSTYYADSLPSWVKDFNSRKFQDIYLEREWNTVLPASSYTESLPDNNKYEKGIKGQTVFPYNLYELANVKKRKPDYNILKSTPFGNSFVKDFAISVIVNEDLGKDDYPDVLNICFTSTENIGSLFGPNSVEVEDAFLRLDQELAHFLNFIDETIGKENVLIYLTSDHGISHMPDYLNDFKIPAGYFNEKGAVALLKSALSNVYGQGDWVKAYNSQQVYLNRTLIEDANIPLNEIQDYTARFLLQFSGVANTVTSTTLQTTNFSGGIFEKIQNGFNQKRSGDVIINLKSGWIEKGEESSNAGFSYAYDSRIPLIWYGWKIGRNTILKPVDIRDIAPTISAFLNITYPNACTGNPVLELIK
jgi:predicted AlkP superfamily pyrophosphatase or phosphodiesterase